jgi:hypothetical protein
MSLRGSDGFGGTDVADRWHVFNEKLAQQGATMESLRSVERRLSAEHPSDSQAIAVLAAQDGMSLVDYDLELPGRETASVSPLPSAGLLLEWQQRKIPTLLVWQGSRQTAIETYAIEGLKRHYSFSHSPAETIKVIGKLATAVGAQLVMLAGQVSHLKEMSDGLIHGLPLTCRLVTEPDVATRDQLTQAMVRVLGVGSAGVTLRHLREQRFLATHGAAVEGIGATIQALRGGDAEVLLIHECPRDLRTVWIGDLPRQLSETRTQTCTREVALVDGLLRASILSGTSVRMIPATGPSGPMDDVAAVTLGGGLPDFY